MGFSGKAKSSSEGWGLGLLLVFFLDDDNDEIDKKKKLSSSPSSFKSTSSSSSRCSSSSNLLVTRAQSTISICALIVFFTLLLFTLCTFEPTTISSPPTKTDSRFPRRWLTENHKNKNKSKRPPSSSSPSFALQGMGTLFRRGTRAMNDLLVAHLMEDTKDDDLRLFLRTLHRSGLTSRTDVVFIFPSSASMVSSNFSTIIQQENESFLRLVHHYRNKNSNNSFIKMVNGFDVTQFVKSDKKEKQGGEPLWGRRTRFNYSSSSSNPEGENEQGEFNELSWGSVVGFEVSELDPEDSLAGFLDHVPIRLRRWACYPMLLGRVRRNFKHLMLVDVKDVVVLGDPLSRVRNRSAESVFLWTTENAHGKHNRRNSEKTQSHNKKDSKSVSADAIMGGIRGVRRLSNAMLTEIVRAALQHKSKISISDSTILTQLVHNDSLLKNINIITTESPIPETSSLVSKNNPSGRRSSFVYRGNSNLGLFSSLLKEICSSPLDSSVYRDC